MSDDPMNPNDSSPFDSIPEGSSPQDLPLQGADEFDDQETIPAMDESSWLLEEEASEDPEFGHTSVHALPDAFAETPTEGWLDGEQEPVEAQDDDGVYEDDLVGASYVEPETSGHALSKALVPASVVLLVSFGGVGAWAYFKHAKEAPTADPVAAVAEAEVEHPEQEPEVELVKPNDGGVTPIGRMSYQRDGAIVPAKGYGNAPTGKATVDSPREPGELPPGQSIQEIAEAATTPDKTEPQAPGNDAPSPVGEGELDIEIGTYADSGESGLHQGEEAEGDSFEVPEQGSGEDSSTQGTLAGTLSPAFFEQFVLDVEPLDDAALGMLEGMEEDAAEVADASPEVDMVRIAPLPGDEIYGSLAWTYPTGGRFPMSPAATYLDGIEDANPETAPLDDIASSDEGAPVPEADSTLSGDFMPFGFFDDDRASLDIAPEIHVLDVTELTPPLVDQANGDAAGAEADGPETDVAQADDNLSTGSLDAFDLGGAFTNEGAGTDMPDLEPTQVIESEAVEITAVAEPEDDSSAAQDVVVADTITEAPVDSAVVSPDVAAAEEPEGQDLGMPAEPEAVVADVTYPADGVEDAAVEDTEVAMTEEPETTIDLDDAHARLDAIFGPTPTEVQPVVPMVVDPAVSDVGEQITEVEEPMEAPAEVVVEVAPEMSDVFPAPDIAAADGTVPPSENPGETPGENPGEVADEEVGEKAGEETAAVTVAEEAPADDSTGTSGVAPAEEVAVESPMGPDVAATTAPTEEGGDIAAADVPPAAEQPEPAVAEPVGPRPGDIKVAAAESTDEATTAPVEVRPNLADEVKSPRRGSVLTRVGNGEIWPHRTVPKSKLKGETFVLTPNVGQVRIVFDGGDTLDGRLHGVGDHKIALDTRLGRLTLDARRVDRLDRLGRKSQRAASGEVSTKGLEKVRVQADGGVFLGHLLSRDGNRVTLLLSEGMRVTLESDDIRPAGRQKSVSRLRRPKK